jgi:hypothetical protein
MLFLIRNLQWGSFQLIQEVSLSPSRSQRSCGLGKKETLSDVASWEWSKRWSSGMKEATMAWRRGWQLQCEKGEIFVLLVLFGYF